MKPIKRFRVVGWFSPNPLDTHVVPFAVVAHVDVYTKDDAFSRGMDAIDGMVSPKAQFLNWYVQEVVSAGTEASIGT